MLAPYILGSEMSIVGPPPSYLGGVFFCKKTALGSTLRSGTEGYMTHYAYSLISERLVCRPFSAASDVCTLQSSTELRLDL